MSDSLRVSLYLHWCLIFEVLVNSGLLDEIYCSSLDQPKKLLYPSRCAKANLVAGEPKTTFDLKKKLKELK